MDSQGLIRPPAGARQGHSSRGMLAVAIDFGTTYSGYAYSFRTDFDRDPLQIYSQNFVSEDSARGSISQNAKVPTTVLFDPDKKFDSFGFAAEDKYAHLCKENPREARNWYYFERFKMNLHNNRSLERDMPLMDFTHKKSMRAGDVFAAAIRYLKEHLTQTLIQTRCPVEEKDISWVLTVPAIWDDQARQFMREAATTAGIDGNHLQLALEPESASIFCQKYFQTQNMSSMHVDLSTPGVRFMVVDCGGGTIDITVYEITEEKKLKELYRPTGGAWGGTKVDEAFKLFLYDVAGFDAVAGFDRLEMLELYREFEQLKRTPQFAEKVPLRLPNSIKEAMGSEVGKSGRYEGRVAMVRNRLMIDREVVEEFFSEPCHAIVRSIEEVLNQGTVINVRSLLLVGGFSESTLLQKAVREAFPHYQVLVPDNPAATILKGAVMFCHRPSVVGWRASAYTYGVDTCREFISSDPSSKLLVVDGMKKCQDVFKKYITINEIVEVDQVFPSQTFHPLYSQQTECLFKIFTSPDCDPSYTTDPGCRKIGSVTVLMPDLRGDRDRKIHCSMVVGGIELRVIARDENTQREFTTKCDFLANE